MAQDDLTRELKARGLTGFYGLLPADQEALMMLGSLVSANKAVETWLSFRFANAEVKPVLVVENTHSCPRCQGVGEYEEPCQECGGEGLIQTDAVESVVCDFCGGEGTVWLPCYNCPAS